MKTYTCKLKSVQAIQYRNNWNEVKRFVGKALYKRRGRGKPFIRTEQGDFDLEDGDYITKDKKGNVFTWTEYAFKVIFKEK